jgi:hypothetical protein
VVNLREQADAVLARLHKGVALDFWLEQLKIPIF